VETQGLEILALLQNERLHCYIKETKGCERDLPSVLQGATSGCKTVRNFRVT